MGDSGYNRKDDIFSKPVRAGKRTYFFDVKATRGDDYYLTITESKRRMDDDGQFVYDKHKLFLYKEDFDKFAEGFESCINFIRENKGSEYGNEPHESHVNRGPETSVTPEVVEPVAEASEVTTETTPENVNDSSFSDVSFDDLGKENEG